ncbi:sulfotransferase [Alcanivorax jadensis]|uniref:sulfotransferase n=1 Tax=Alcanivorax jadensis TaxID=64988 RepID=UPI0039C8870D
MFPESILSVSYEALVSDPEAVTRRIATHCGLDWQSGMLAFQGHKRVVMTASALQVREGLFSSSAGRWARYGELLRPLMVVLEREGVDWQSYNNNKGAE